MEYRQYKDAKISLLGFGCMRLPVIRQGRQDIDEAQAQAMIDYAIDRGVNYFDTAYPYHDGLSEPFLGRALKKYPRNSYYLATKMPMWELRRQSDLERIFAGQLKKCQTDYFDFYLQHSMERNFIKTDERLDVHGFLQKKKQQGIIRNLGFSFHDSPDILRRIVKGRDWDFAQIQLNYLDWTAQNAKEQYEILEQSKIPVIIMEPVRGGSLANVSTPADRILKAANPNASAASWAMRFAASLPGVITVLSGMSTMEHVRDNVATFSPFVSMSDDERIVLEKTLTANRATNTVPCTGCRYCMDCPSGVNIPEIFDLYNQARISPDDGSALLAYNLLGSGHDASNCTQCGVCVPKCPQHIDIPDWMRRIDKRVTALNKE